MYNIKGKNILVTGGGGFVGSHLVEALLNKASNVVVVDIFFNKKSYFIIKNLNTKVKVINLDICDYDKLLRLLKDNKIDFIFHLAAQALVGEAYREPKYTLINNITSTINILEAVRVNPKIKGVIVASSDKCYGKLHKSKYIETDPLSGDHPYDTSKSATDMICSTYFSTYKIPVVITRFGNIYGEGDLSFSRIVPSIMTSIIEKKTLKIRSNGKYIRDYLYVKDVVEGYILLAENIEKINGQAFNFGSTDNLSVLEVIQIAEKVFKQKIKYDILNIATNEIPYQSLNYAKIKKIGWKQKYTLKKILKQIFYFYKNII